MAKINWENDGKKRRANNRGALCVKDENELREGDAAAKWLAKNDTPQNPKNPPWNIK
jgi:hypothetical protein